MNAWARGSGRRLAGLAAMSLVVVLLAGCATYPKIDWSGRIGSYSFDNAVIEFGPPDRQARLEDGTLVAEWLLRRGYSRIYPAFYGFGCYPYYYGPFYPTYIDTYPDYHLRLVFGPDARLKDWKKFYK